MVTASPDRAGRPADGAITGSNPSLYILDPDTVFPRLVDDTTDSGQFEQVLQQVQAQHSSLPAE